MNKFEIKPNKCYLIKEEKTELSMKIFKDSISKKNSGLCITRIPPMVLKEEHGLENSKFIWLTFNRSEETIIPKNLTRLGREISKFIQTEKNGVVALFGVEYLIAQNNYEVVLNLLFFLQDEVSVNQSSLIISLNPAILKENELKLMERYLDVITANDVVTE